MSVSYLEFYSGVGGWSFALEKAIRHLNETRTSNNDDFNTELKMVHLGAFDHSDLCNKVLHYNFPQIIDGGDQSKPPQNCKDSKPPSKKRKKPTKAMKTVSIESLTKKQLEEKCALIWMMSPPCQPHTRQHNNQGEDIQDPRSKSFMHLCDMISTMKAQALPKVILLENVVGFAKSNSCQMWRKALRLRKYSVSHFHLNPTHCKIPNDRPRYYAIAVLLDSEISLSLSKGHKRNTDDSILQKWFEGVMETNRDNLDDCPPIQTSIDILNVCDNPSGEEIMQLSDFLDSHDLSQNSSLYVPEKLLKSNSSWCFDIVTPSNRRSACFTSSYGKFIRGTGSVIAENVDDSAMEKFRLVPPDERKFDSNWADGLAFGNLRYFSGIEIARIFGFPVDVINADDNRQSPFRFPPDCTLKQQWKLMGNSLNVQVAAKICEAALRLVLYHKTSQTTNE